MPAQSQDAPKPATAAACVAEALSAVEGWSWGIQEAVRRTDPDSISRSGIRDRCGVAGEQHVQGGLPAPPC